MPSPAVSVIMPVLNGERFLGEALASCFGQTLPPAEVIVVDDGSEDRTPEIARSWPVRYVRKERGGHAAAFNTGIAESRGELVAFLDHDDLWLPEKLERQVAYLVDRPEIQLVMCLMESFLEPGIRRPAWVKPEWLAEPQPGYLPSAFLGRRELFVSLGGFDARYAIGADTDLLARAKDAGAATAVLREVLLRRRIHDRNVSHRNAELRSELMHVLHRTARRQRGLAEGSEERPGA